MSIIDRLREYRDDDEEMYVYDQCCGNCARCGGTCPFEDYVEDENAPIAKKQAMKEDAIFRDGQLEWCIYWRQRRGYGR